MNKATLSAEEVERLLDEICNIFPQHNNEIDTLSKSEIDALHQKAEQGNTEAQYDLGCYYRYRRGNDIEAIKWFHKAAERGHVEAQFSLGMCYYYDLDFGGSNVPEDKEEAIKWLRKAAEQGHGTARIRLYEMARKQEKWERIQAWNVVWNMISIGTFLIACAIFLARFLP
jgi:TPR repeat protein